MIVSYQVTWLLNENEVGGDLVLIRPHCNLRSGVFYFFEQQEEGEKKYRLI